MMQPTFSGAKYSRDVLLMNSTVNSMKASKPDVTGLIALFGGAAAISLAPLFVRMSETGPTATAFYRLLLAQPALWILLQFSRVPDHPQNSGSSGDHPLRPSIKSWPWFGLAGAMFAFDMGFWHESIHMTSIANSTLIANAAPFFVILGARIFFHERMPPRFLLLVAMAIIGTALLVQASFSTSGLRLKGDIFALITAFFYGAYQLCVKYLRNRNFHPISILAYSGIPSMILLGIGAVLLGEKLSSDQSQTWMALSGLALFSHVGGQGLIVFAFGRLPASMASLGLLLQPLLVILLGWGFYGEKLGLWQIIGAIVLMASLYLATISPAPGGRSIPD